MGGSVQLYEVPGAVGSRIVRIALGYKEIAYEAHAVRPEERSELVRLSGQPQAPVLLHGDVVLFQANAILRYLDANFRSAPRLFSVDVDALAAIERWERFGRYELCEPLEMVERQAAADEPDASVLEVATRLQGELSTKLEQALEGREWLVGEAMTAADIACAAVVAKGLEGEGGSPVDALVRTHLAVGPERKTLRAWAARTLIWDR